MKIRDKFGRIPLPGWLFVVLMVLYNEWMLHLWITKDFLPGRVLAVTAFALGFGGVLAFLTSLIPNPRASKWTAVGISLVVTVFWIAEYFISDAYQVFMTPKLMISGAGGVATDYLELVVSLIVRNLWRIGLMLLPIVLYGLFCQSTRSGWSLRGILAAAAVVCYMGGVAAVDHLTGDSARFDAAYNFDSTVRCFGLNMALTLETLQGSREEAEPAFVAAPTQPTVPAKERVPETTEAAAAYGDNIIEALDFDALIAGSDNRNVTALHEYVRSLTPTRQNEYTGLFKGKNLILITAEAFSKEVIDPELTPTLYRMANEGIRFTEYYQPAWGASTTSGEFSNLVGLVPVTGGMCMREAVHQNLFLTMGNQLQELGYYSAAYHNHLYDFYDRDETHIHLGYDRYIAQYGGLEGVDPVWTESDKQLIDATIGDYIGQQPFSIYYMTVSGHCMYSQSENFQAKKNYDKVADMDASEAVKCYLASQLELEYAMEALIGYLEEAGIADDTVIVMATDHYPYGLERSATWKNTSDYLRELYGVEDYDFLTRDHNALIIWSGCLEDMDIVVDEPVYSLDILPTVANLFGVDYDSRLLVGRDVFSDADPLVLWPDFSWKTDKGTYDAKTRTFTPNQGVEVAKGYVDYISSIVSNKVTYSKSVQTLDYFNYLADALGLEK